MASKPSAPFEAIAGFRLMTCSPRQRRPRDFPWARAPICGLSMARYCSLGGTVRDLHRIHTYCALPCTLFRPLGERPFNSGAATLGVLMIGTLGVLMMAPDNGLVCAASTVHSGITGSAARLAKKLKDRDNEARRTLVMANRRRKGPGGGYVTQAAPQPKLIADYTAAMGGTLTQLPFEVHCMTMTRWCVSIPFRFVTVRLINRDSAGVDLADQLRSYNTVHRKCKVWFRALYYWACKSVRDRHTWGACVCVGGGGMAIESRFVFFVLQLYACPHLLPTRACFVIEEVDTALINANVLFNELHGVQGKAGMSTQLFRAEVVDGLLTVANVKLPPFVPLRLGGGAIVADCSVPGVKDIIPVARLQHVLVVEAAANKRGDCALCGKKTNIKCTTCLGPHKKGLWFCIAADRNCWACVHTQ